ncbi:DUF2924 domain-containing protein [Sinirhodobacter sp. WL0062]|uniref:DUF2924 domain-containing protein n=1 Tax=Rhodobacter flavimaris TaxID=2907145 RepID=A0ABS8YUM5_9RHOB|nr:DUF2924 domain-containing protein [Sinirhodobacter sp. WL0062]MCE5972780.1 DUF2924 domain-containing protein [Sinirhodobacter sp. WL0062]
MRRDYAQGEVTAETRVPRRARRRGTGDNPEITVSEIEALDRAALSTLWTDLFGEAVPAKMSQPILRRFIAFEIQAQAEGGLPTSLVGRLARIAAGDDRRATPELRSGSRLLREWSGTTHVVELTENGFLWDGVRHRSLSAIARAITGARWSGLRFFGLTDASVAPAKRKVRSS